MIRVVVVDDHPMVRLGLNAFLSTQPDITVVGDAANGTDAIHRCVEAKPDVILMDMLMPDLDGAAATTRIKEACPQSRVVVLTSFAEPELVKRALEAGALSYLLKDTEPAKLADAIRQAHAGRGTIDSSVVQGLLEDRQSGRPAAGEDLTRREREVLSLLAQGLTNREIAVRLFLSTGTVRLHVSSILRKLEVQNRTAAALWAVEHGLVEPPPR